MHSKSNKMSRRSQDQKMYAPWIRLQMTWNFKSVISKHIKKKYHWTSGKFFVKKIIFEFMYSPRGIKESRFSVMIFGVGI